MFTRTEVVERSHQAFHLARTLTFLGEYKLLHNFTRLFRPWVEVPERYQDKQLRSFLLNDIEQLFSHDAKLFSGGVLPLSILKPESPLQHAWRLGQILYTGVKMSRLRKVKDSTPKKGAEGLPEYYTRNFHWQIDGYLTEDSAKIYDHQVEILFTGTAQAMRRLVFSPINNYLKNFAGSAHILEIAAGTGELAHAMTQAYPQHHLTVSDLSAPYLQIARKRLSGHIVDFVSAAAEELPFKDQSQDVIYAVFLFHELPTEVRGKVMLEVKRVLKPGGLFVTVDSIQENEVPEYAWALEKFPRDYHEPFYRGYTKWPLEEAFKRNGFTAIESKRGFFSKVVAGIKSSSEQI